MKKSLLTFATAILAVTASAQLPDGLKDMGTLPLDEQFTVNKGEVYSFNPESDGVLSISFEGRYPETSLLYSNCYNINFNPGKEMLPYSSSNSNPALGQQSPALFEIHKLQPDGSGAEVSYYLVGPDETAILDPSQNIYSMTITCAFTPAGEGDVLEPSIYPEPGGYFDFNTIGNLEIRFEPATFGVTCGGIKIDMYKGDTWLKSISGADREITWEYNPADGYYYLSLVNLYLYELSGTQVDNFTITLSDFNKELAGEYVNDNGELAVSYLYDEWYGIVRYVGSTPWPTAIFPGGARPSTVTLTYEEELSTTLVGEVVVIGADLAQINEEPNAKTNIYEAAFLVDGKTISVDFNDFRQTGPVNDSGAIVSANGYKTNSSGMMTVIVRGFASAEGGQVEPVMEHIKWVAEDPGDNGSSGVEAVSAPVGYDVYSLQGIRLLDGASLEAVKALPRSIYIINGQKVWNR